MLSLRGPTLAEFTDTPVFGILMDISPVLREMTPASRKTAGRGALLNPGPPDGSTTLDSILILLLKALTPKTGADVHSGWLELESAIFDVSSGAWGAANPE
jgi:hypothetical protein